MSLVRSPPCLVSVVEQSLGEASTEIAYEVAGTSGPSDAEVVFDAIRYKT